MWNKVMTFAEWLSTYKEMSMEDYNASIKALQDTLDQEYDAYAGYVRSMSTR